MFTIRRNKDPLEGEHATLREAIDAARAAYEPTREAIVIERGEEVVAKIMPGSESLLIKAPFIGEVLGCEVRVIE